MFKKQTLYSMIFSSICFLFFIISMFLNRSYFEAIAYDNVFFYQTKQLLAIILLFAMGFLFLLAVRTQMPLRWTILFAFPVGACLWAFVSLVLLLTGISYTFWITAAFNITILALVWMKRLFSLQCSSDANRFSLLEEIPLFLLLFGLACLASSGFIYKFVSYDSYFYFTNYGHTLTLVGNFKDIVGGNSFTLTNINQFLPLLNSYTAFWGLDQCFQVQAFMTANVVVCFFCGLYEYTSAIANKKALIYSALFTLLLLSSTSFITISTWVLANMYCMVYIFLLFIASFLVSHLDCGKREAILLISIFFAGLTLLRKDGIIFAAFFLVCFCSKELFSGKQLALMFLPSVIAECWWLYYVRIVLNPEVSQGTYSSIANNKNIFFVACVIIGGYLYVFVGHSILKWLENHVPFLTEYGILFIGMFFLLYLSFVKKADIIIDNVDFVIRNMFRYPSSWGISALFFGVILVFALVREFRLDYLHFFWSGYAFLNLVSYCIVDNKSFWVNWDDSYNRVLLQIIPVFVFIMAVRVAEFLQSTKCKSNSDS